MTIEELEAKLEIVTKHRDAWKKMLDETNRHVLDLAALVEPGLHRHPVTVLQATHAFILNLMNERDEAKKEAAESSKEMIMLFSDHSSIELEKQLRIEELTRERDKFQALAELGEGYRRERDEARAEADRLRESVENGLDPHSCLRWELKRAEMQRDEARASVKVLQRAADKRGKERDEARAEVQRLTDERDELLVRVANQDAELRATREAYGMGALEKTTRERDEARERANTLAINCESYFQDFCRMRKERDEARAEVERLRSACAGSDLAEHYYRRGAEAMREACMGWCKTWENDGDAIADALADLSIPGEP